MNCLITDIKRPKKELSVLKPKPKVIILANQNRGKQSSEPNRARSKYMSPAPSAGNRVRASHD